MSLFDTEAPPRIRLRPYQGQAIERVNELVASGKRRVVIVAPTGSGKTTIAAQLVHAACRRGKRCLFLAHRRELVNQAHARLSQFGLGDHLGVLMAEDERARPDAPIQIATVATVHRRQRPPADLVIEDECHRVLARTHRDLAEHYQDAIRIGLTATPYRSDGQPLGDVYDELVVAATPAELVEAGYLVEPKLVRPITSLPDLDRVSLRAGDYNEQELARIIDARRLAADALEQWLTHAHDKRTLVFATNVAHSRLMTRRFRLAGVPAEHLDGTTPTADRDAILRRLATGKTQVVCGVSVLSEGFDEPAVKCVLLARPTKSLGLYLQQVGRALRPWRNQGAVVIDCAGCARIHGMPGRARQLSLAFNASPGSPAG